MVTDNHEPPADEFTSLDQRDTVHAPRLVIGDRGAGWVVESWDRFKAAAGQWIALCIVGLVIIIIIDYIPGLSLLNALFKPVWMAGLMVACHAQFSGKPVEVKHLFAGFSSKAGSLIVCGLIESIVTMVLFLILLGPVIYDVLRLMFPDSAAPGMLDLTRITIDIEDRATLNRVLAGIDLYTLLIRVLILLALLVPMWAATWFAPALIMLGNKSVKEALILSFTGTLKNTWPFLIYSLCGMLLCLLIPVTLGLALLALGPMLYLSIYLSYRDIYLD